MDRIVGIFSRKSHTLAPGKPKSDFRLFPNVPHNSVSNDECGWGGSGRWKVLHLWWNRWRKVDMESRCPPRRWFEVRSGAVKLVAGRAPWICWRSELIIGDRGCWEYISSRTGSEDIRNWRSGYNSKTRRSGIRLTSYGHLYWTESDGIQEFFWLHGFGRAWRFFFPLLQS